MMRIVRTEEEVQDLQDKCADEEPKFPGMTYEAGVMAGIDWLIGEYGEGYPLD